MGESRRRRNRRSFTNLRSRARHASVRLEQLEPRAMLAVNSAPADIFLSSTQVSENLPSGTVVGILATADTDASDTFAYSLVSGTGSSDNSSFSISGNQVRVTASLNFEAKNSYAVRIRATDQGGLFTEKSFTITVADVNESPTLVSAVRLSRIPGDGYARLVQDGLFMQAGVQYRFTARFPTSFTPTPPDNIPEYWGNGTVVQTTSESVTSHDGWTYYEALSTPESTGTYELKLALWSDSLDVTDISVRPAAGGAELVRDGRFTQGLSQWYTHGGRIQLVDVPLLSSPSISLPESTNALSRLKAFDVRFSDDGAGINTVSLSGDDASLFEVDGSSVYVRAGVVLDYETQPTYSVKVGVADASLAGASSLASIFLLSLTNSNETPTDISLSSTTIAENAGVNAAVGTLTTADPDASDTFAYSLVSGTGSTDNSLFTISGNQLRASATFDFETKNTYSIRVRSTDQGGLATEKALTILIVDVQESSSFSYGFKHVNEAGAEQYLIDSSGMRKYSEWQSTPITYWGPSANSAEGRLVYMVPFGAATQSMRLLAHSPSWDFFTEPGGFGRGCSSLEVSRDGTDWISLRNSLEPRQWGLDWIYDDALPAAVLGGTSLWVRMRFYVESSPNSSYTTTQFGRSTAAATANVFQVQATLSQNSAPSDITLSASTIAENAGANAVIGTLSSVDPDAANTFTYALVAGDGDTDNASFNIIGNQLRANASLDFETKSSYSIRVRSSDSGGLFTEKAFTISVSDVRSAVFWLSNGAIYRGATDGSFHHVVVGSSQSDGGVITNLAVDQSGTRIYWSELSSMPGTSKIYSSRVDGSDIRVVYNGSSLGWINYGMAVDEAAGYVFLHSHDPAPVPSLGPHYDGKIQRISIASGEVVTLASAVWYARLFADPSSQFVYYTDISGFASGSPSIYSLNGLKKQAYDGSGLTSIPVSGEVPSGPVVADAAAGKLYYATGEGSQAKGIWSVDIGGGSGTLIAVTTSSVYGLGVDAQEGEVFWADSEGIHRIRIDGTEPTTLFSPSPAGSFAPHTSGFFVVPEDSDGSPVDLVISATTINENQPAGTVVGTLSTNSLSADSGITYEVFYPEDIDLHGDTAYFSISEDRLLTTAAFDYELKNSYVVRIRATAGSGLSTEKEFRISIGNVNESPGSTTPTITFDNVAAYQDFIQYAEPGFILTATPGHVRINDGFSQGNNAAQPSFGFGQGMDSRLTLKANQGQPFHLKAMDLLEATGFPAPFSVIVTGTRLDNSTVSQTLTLDGIPGAETFLLPATFKNLKSVIVQEDPTNQHYIDIVAIDNVAVQVEPILISSSEVAENTAIGTSVGTFTTTDPDIGDSFTYTLVAGEGSVDNAFFTLEGNKLQTSAVFNYEAKGSYSIRVRSTDAGGLFTEKAFEIAISDVAELPSAPLIAVPEFFSVIEDIATPLQFTSSAITDEDSPQTKIVTVRLTVADGAINAASAAGVTVGGRPTARTFTGSIAGLNDYFAASPSRIMYVPSLNNAAARTLTARVTEAYEEASLSSLARSRILITPVNDAPTVAAPVSFTFTEDTRGNLRWPVVMNPFGDVDSGSLFITLSVADGEIAAAGTKAVAVGGTPTARTFSGSVASLNAYFKKMGSISYMPAANNVSSRTLTTSVSDGLLSASAVSTISITAVNDAPTVAAAATLTTAATAAPVEITYEMLRAGVQAADVDGPSLSLLITQLDSGSLQKWNGATWVAISVSPSVPRAQRTISAGQIIRWIPPTGMTGTKPAFRVRAWDGLAMSSTMSRVAVNMQ